MSYSRSVKQVLAKASTSYHRFNGSWAHLFVSLEASAVEGGTLQVQRRAGLG
jgi:hypothetical protein